MLDKIIAARIVGPARDTLVENDLGPGDAIHVASGGGRFTFDVRRTRPGR